MGPLRVTFADAELECFFNFLKNHYYDSKLGATVRTNTRVELLMLWIPLFSKIQWYHTIPNCRRFNGYKRLVPNKELVALSSSWSMSTKN